MDTYTVKMFLVEELRSASNWRWTKSAEHPEDQRNTRSATALAAASQYVEQAYEPFTPGLEKLIRVVTMAADGPGEGDLRLIWPAPEASREMGRFFFRPGPMPAREHDFDGLFMRLADLVMQEAQKEIAAFGDVESPTAARTFFMSGQHPDLLALDNVAVWPPVGSKIFLGDHSGVVGIVHEVTGYINTGTLTIRVDLDERPID